MQAKRKVKSKSSQDEQLRLLRQILAELQKLNASLSANTARQPATEQGMPSDVDSDDEELEDYE